MLTSAVQVIDSLNHAIISASKTNDKATLVPVANEAGDAYDRNDQKFRNSMAENLGGIPKNLQQALTILKKKVPARVMKIPLDAIMKQTRNCDNAVQDLGKDYQKLQAILEEIFKANSAREWAKFLQQASDHLKKFQEGLSGVKKLFSSKWYAQNLLDSLSELGKSKTEEVFRNDLAVMQNVSQFELAVANSYIAISDSYLREMSSSARLTSLGQIETEEKRQQEEKSLKEKKEQMEKNINNIVIDLNGQFEKLIG